MEEKILEIILFKKRFFFLFFFFSFFLLLYFNFFRFLSLSFPLYVFKNEIFDGINLGLDYISLTFILILFLVTCLVNLFREIYIDGYNLGKFFFIKLIFFYFIILLIFSNSILLLIIRWDGLGISSLCLILFYPNKFSLFNSYLTLIYNRLGDILIILIFCFFLFNPFSFFFLSNEFYFILFLICSFTKRAQFPLSTWLPAAISAPTPISAIVHSSTLVTAGVFLNFKIENYYSELGLLDYLGIIRCFTFLIGGYLAYFEIDIKKVVAFSTIRQISMIMIFISLNLPSVALIHTVFHAFFKTLLFCRCGIIFLTFFRDQITKKFKFFSNNMFSLLIFRIFIITGLLFSSSFVTKDFVFEFLHFNCSRFFFILILGSLLTSMYSSKLIYSLVRIIKFRSIYFDKNKNFFFIFFFRIFSLLSYIIFKNLIFIDFIPLRTLDILILTFVLISPI